MNENLLFGEEVYGVIGAAMEVHRTLGCGFLEAVYQEALALEFSERMIPFLEQVGLEVRYKNRVLKKRYIADFVVHGEIIVELKATEFLAARDTAQLLNYLHATGTPLGLLINFGASGKLEWTRLINAHHSVAGAPHGR